jgi:MFS family permease
MNFGMQIVYTDELSIFYNAQIPGYSNADDSIDPTLFTSLTVVGLMTGSIGSEFVVGKGRRLLIIISALIGLVGGLLQVNMSYNWVLAGKIICGFAAGSILTGASIYMTETVPVERRNSYGFCLNLGVTLGISLITFSGFALPTEADGEQVLETTNAWLGIVLLSPIINTLTLILWMFVIRVEPYEYCVKNENKRGMKPLIFQNLKSIYRIGDNDELAKELYEQLKSKKMENSFLSSQDGSVIGSMEEAPEPGMWRALADPKFRRGTLIACMMAMSNQLTGVNAINFYSSIIFGAIFTGSSAVTITKSLTGLVQVLGVCFAPCLARSVGLSTTFLIGHGSAAVLLGLVTILSAFADLPMVTGFLILLFMCMFQATIGSNFFPYIGEITTPSAISLAHAYLFVWVLIISLITPILFGIGPDSKPEVGEASTFAIFTICNIISFISHYYLLKDTTGLSKQELEQLYWTDGMKVRQKAQMDHI